MFSLEKVRLKKVMLNLFSYTDTLVKWLLLKGLVYNIMVIFVLKGEE